MFNIETSELFLTRIHVGLLEQNIIIKYRSHMVRTFWGLGGWEHLQDSQPVTALKGFLWPESHTVWLPLLAFSFLLFFKFGWFVCFLSSYQRVHCDVKGTWFYTQQSIGDFLQFRDT